MIIFSCRLKNCKENFFLYRENKSVENNRQFIFPLWIRLHTLKYYATHLLKEYCVYILNMAASSVFVLAPQAILQAWVCSHDAQFWEPCEYPKATSTTTFTYATLEAYSRISRIRHLDAQQEEWSNRLFSFFDFHNIFIFYPKRDFRQPYPNPHTRAPIPILVPIPIPHIRRYLKFYLISQYPFSFFFIHFLSLLLLCKRNFIFYYNAITQVALSKYFL